MDLFYISLKTKLQTPVIKTKTQHKIFDQSISQLFQKCFEAIRFICLSNTHFKNHSMGINALIINEYGSLTGIPDTAWVVIKQI